MSSNATSHFTHLIELLELEAVAEQAQLRREIARQDQNNGLRRLVIREETWGLGDRLLLTLAPKNQSESLPWSRLDVGSPVLLVEETGRSDHDGWRGVISRKTREIIQIALSHSPEPEADRPTFRLDLSTDEISRRRMIQALTKAAESGSGRLADLRRVLLEERPPYFRKTRPQLTFFDDTLNPSQKNAVVHALTAADVALIHGPPGTGKTTAVVELIRQAVRRGEKVLACAPSNMGVDNLLEKLLEAPEISNVLRLGHPARVLPRLHSQTLDQLVDEHPNVQLARKLRKDAHGLFGKADRFTRAKPLPGEKAGLRREAREMLAEAADLEQRAVTQIIDRAQVVCATTTSLSGRLLGERRFELCVIDEAGQSVEAGCWIPLPWAERVVLAGDHCQLPPTVLSVEAERRGLGVSLLERLMVTQGETLSRQLTIQYRMHEKIMGFSSVEFYDDTLTADPTVAGHRLIDLPGISSTPLTETPLTFIDTAGAGYEEELEPAGESRLNRQEAELVARKVCDLLEAGLSPSAMGVITPYAAQVRLLKSMLPESVEINSVDGFQGREKEAIVMSLVRSNVKGEIGFLAERRRLNVALTRARRKLLVVGDSATITVDPFFGRLVDYFEQHDGYRSVWEDLV